MQTFEQLKTSSSDIAVGVLPLFSDTLHVAEVTITYFL
jgi:hypothetical protein